MYQIVQKQGVLLAR